MRSFLAASPLLLANALTACRLAPATTADDLPEWRATRVATIGADTGRNSFASVRSLLFSARGELYVVDQREKQVKVFDTTGTFVRLLGRNGAGPNEYADPYSVAWLHDTLALLDPRSARIGLFAPNGTWRSLPVQPISGGSDIRLYRGSEAAFWIYGYRVVGKQPENLFIRYTGAGPGDTLPFIRSPDAHTTITCETSDRGLHFFSAPYAASDLLIPTPTGARAFATTDQYRILLLGARGDTIGMLTYDEAPRPITDQAWNDGLAEWNEFRTKSPSAKCDGSDFTRPAHMPVLGALINGPEGRLWVEVLTAEGSRYDLWQGGRRVGKVTGLPLSAEVDPAFFGDLVALPLPDNGAGPQVGIYRLTQAP